MSVELHQEIDGKLAVVQLSGKLTKEDYERFVPDFEKMIAQHGKIRVLFQMSDFHGWNAAALWEDVKVGFQHATDIERIAMVGDKAWEEGMAFFCKPFTSAEVRYFGHHELERARQWVSEGVVAGSEDD